MEKKLLLQNVRLAINPQFEDWVLFENGTYIVFDNIEIIDDVKDEAIQLMKKFGPILIGGAAGDFGITTLTNTDGWVVSGHGYGMYTYVHPTEIDMDSPNDTIIGLYGRSKRDLDGQKPNVIYINSSKN